MNYPHYYLYVDHRGSPYKLLKDYLGKHPRFAKDYTLIKKENFKADVLIVKMMDSNPQNKRVTWLVELCITDMRAKLMNGQLKRELWGDPTENYITMAQKYGAENIAVIGAEIYKPKVYQMLNSMMQKSKGIYVYLPTTPEKAVEKMFYIINHEPDSILELNPVLKKGELGFGLSISSLVHGCTAELGVELAMQWYDEITESEILKIVNNYMNRNKEITREYPALTHKIYNMAHKTWLRNKKPSIPLKEIANL